MKGTGETGRVRRWRSALIEVTGLLLVLLIFTRLHAAAGKGVAAAATANAQTLQSIERALHIDIELTANRWLTGHPILIQPAVYYYRLYYIVLASVMIWVFVRHWDVYTRIRRTLVAMTFLVLPVFWALPMAPPRLALPGIVDIIAAHDIFPPREGQNSYSAMPSLHVGWSLWCGYAAWSALRAAGSRWAPVAWVFPAGMVAVVIVTGNHYVLDIAGSVALLGISIAAASLWGRLADRRPDVDHEAASVDAALP